MEAVTILAPALSGRILDAIALLLVVAPFANLVFLITSIRRFRSDPGRSPLLSILIVVDVVIWLIGVLTAVFSFIYLARPYVDPTTPTGVLFGIALLLIQALPHYINLMIRRLETRSMR